MITCLFENGKQASLRHAVVDALVIKGDKILLVKRTKKILEGGKWALVGGFVDRGETLEETVEREVFEETGWRIRDLRLLRIIDSPKRPNEDRQNIAFVYTCRGTSKTGEPDQESSEQKWFKLSELPPKEEFAFDHFDDIEFYLNKK